VTFRERDSIRISPFRSRIPSILVRVYAAPGVIFVRLFRFFCVFRCAGRCSVVAPLLNGRKKIVYNCSIARHIIIDLSGLGKIIKNG